MTRNPPLAAVLMSTLALAACNREAAEPATPVDQTPPAATATTPAAPPIGYACESGETVMVQYPDTGTAQVAYNGQTYTLRIAPSGSGARYAGSGVEWWTASRNGLENATLSRLGPNEQVGTVVLERCSRPSSNPDLPTPGPDPVSSAGVAGVACRTADLRLSVETGDAGAGNRVQLFGLTNAGTTPCSVAGYPAVSLLDAQGRALSAVRSEQNPATASPVTVPAGEKAWFDIAWTVVPDQTQGQTACPAAARISVRIAGDPAALAAPVVLSPCNGRIRVNPVRATAERTT